jgi:small subunit ribosomal protein S4
LLERRLDTIVLRAGFAQTIMQARQMVVHGHFLLNNKKHNVPSYTVQQNDIIMLRKEKHGSSLYVNAPVHGGQYIVPTWIKFNKKDYTLEIFDMPNTEDISLPVDLLKVIEFYARA